MHNTKASNTRDLQPIQTFKINSKKLLPFFEASAQFCHYFEISKIMFKKLSKIWSRYGSELVTVESYRQNNFTGELASRSLRTRAGSESSYWLGYRALNNLQTKTLATASGDQINMYYGHWSLTQPNISSGQCVQSVVTDQDQVTMSIKGVS